MLVIKIEDSNNNNGCGERATTEAEGMQRFISHLIGYKTENLQGNYTNCVIIADGRTVGVGF